jgi:hypothetical protein
MRGALAGDTRSNSSLLPHNVRTLRSELLLFMLLNFSEACIVSLKICSFAVVVRGRLGD